MAVQRWMRKRAKETVVEWHRRLNRTCFGCGTEFANTKACDEHETTCSKTRRPGNRDHR